MKTIFAACFFLCFFPGCDDDPLTSGSRDYEAESFEEISIPVTSQSFFEISNTNGTIIISVSDTAENINLGITRKVRSYESRRDAQSHLTQIDVNTEEKTDQIKIKVDHPKNDNRNYTIDFEIIMPDEFNYVVNLGNGNIDISATTKIMVVNLGNGTVETNVVLLDTCQVSYSVGNGNIHMTIPDSTNANVVATLGNGSIFDNGLNLKNPQISNRRLSGTLGNGAGSIVLSLGNGNIYMNKK